MLRPVAWKPVRFVAGTKIDGQNALNITKVMKRTLFSLGLAVIASGLAGCVVSIGGRTQNTPPSPAPPPPPVVVSDPGQAATIGEIDAAAQLSMDSARTHALSQIAERPGLAPPVQVHLINVAYRCLSSENNKVQVLQKMIARPDFCDATRQAIVSQLGQLGFESHKQDLLNRINQRLTQAAQ
jgi:hypothetical protein